MATWPSSVFTDAPVRVLVLGGWRCGLFSCLAPLGAILHIFPVTGPFLAPLEFLIAAHAYLGREPVLNFRFHSTSFLRSSLVALSALALQHRALIG